MAAAGAYQPAVDSDGVAILPLATESDSWEVVHAFTTGSSGDPPVEAPVAVAGAAPPAESMPTPLAAVAPPELDWDMDGALAPEMGPVPGRAQQRPGPGPPE